MPEISVIIATYNRSAILNEALKSVFSQERIQDTEYEVIVVDNNSVDQTKNTVLAMMKDHSAGNLHYWFQPVQGKSAALNLGIEKAKGKIIAFTDDDVLVDKNWLSSIRDCFANTGCDSVGGKVLPLYPEKTPQWVKDNAALLNGPIFIYDFGNEIKPYGPPLCEFYGANFAVKRSIFEELGLFRTELGPSQNKGGEDTEFIRRMIDQGKRLFYCPGAGVLHRVTPEVMTLRYIAKWNISVGRFWYLYKIRGIHDKGAAMFGGVALYLIKDILKDAMLLIPSIVMKNLFIKRWVTLFRNIGIASEMRKVNLCKE